MCGSGAAAGRIREIGLPAASLHQVVIPQEFDNSVARYAEAQIIQERANARCPKRALATDTWTKLRR